MMERDVCNQEKLRLLRMKGVCACFVQNHQKLEIWDTDQGGRTPLYSIKVHSRPVR